MIKALLLFIFLFSTLSLTAQNLNTKIQYEKKTFGGYRYFQNAKKLPKSKLKDVLRNNVEAYRQYKEAQSYAILSNVFGFIGGFMIGNSTSRIFSDRRSNLQLVIIGTGIIVISVPIYSTANRQERYAVDYYNQFIPYSQNTSNELHFGICENGIGLKFKFQ